MAQVQLADVFQRPEFSQTVQEAQVVKNAFVMSGVMAADPELAAACRGTSAAGERVGVAPLGLAEPTYGTDDPTDKLTFGKIENQTHKWRRATRSAGWSAMNLAQAMAYNDPFKGVTNQIGTYWATDVQKRLINSAVGLYNLNAAGDGDLIENVATDAAGAITDAERASALNFLAALELKGDMDNIIAVAMHSTVFYGLRKMRALVEQHDPVSNTTFETFEGKRVIVDNGLPVVKGTNRPTFTSILFGAGAVRSGEGNPPTIRDTEFDRDPTAGNGTGQDFWITRRTDIIMPVGFSFTGSPGTGIAGQFATYAELQSAANWEQIWDSKNIPMSFLLTNA